MHHIYNTEGFVLSGRGVGEANKYFQIFTKDFGLIGAVAQGVRLIQSKLRYSLQDYSYSKISLVKGKRVWRIVGAEKERDYCRAFGNNDKLEVLAKTFSFLERLVRGEEKNEELFENIFSACRFAESEDMDRDSLRNFEYIFIARILRVLGYIGDSKVLRDFAHSSVWTRELVLKMSAVRRDAVIEINKSIKATQL